MIAGTAAILILIVLSDLHVYWARGGKAGKGAAIPTLNERPALKPTALTTIMVAVVLLAMAAVLAFRIGWLDLPAVPGLSSFVRVCAWLIAVAFALRRILQEDTRKPLRATRHICLFSPVRMSGGASRSCRAGIVSRR